MKTRFFNQGWNGSKYSNLQVFRACGEKKLAFEVSGGQVTAQLSASVVLDKEQFEQLVKLGTETFGTLRADKPKPEPKWDEVE